MKRKILTLSLAFIMIFSSLIMVSCGKENPGKGTVTRMTVDINPSVEFMIDDNNKVVSVTALNDDGSILITGEAFVGKAPEESIELMLSVAAETGYLVKGNTEASENNVKISVSGDTKYAKNLLKDIENKTNDTLKKLDIKGKIERVDALTTEALRELALSTSLYSEDELSEMTDEQLNSIIAQGRIETALLITEDLRNAYYSAKEYKISFAESEAVSEIIQSLGGLYTFVHSTYESALDIYSSAITELDNLRYDLLVSPESEYQKSLVKLREAKVELLKQKTYTASLDINGTEYVSAIASLQLAEENYNKALNAYENLGDQANLAMESLIATLKQAKTTLTELEKTIFDENIEAKLAEKATEIETSLNTAKDGFFTEFEAAHAEDITAIKNSLIEKKQQLKAAIEANK